MTGPRLPPLRRPQKTKKAKAAKAAPLPPANTVTWDQLVMEEMR